MPELPEVEFARRALVRWFKGHTLVRTEAQPKVRTFRDSDLGVFGALAGRLDGIDRRGKYLMVKFANQLGFVGHLGMTGKFLKRPAGEDVRWSRARFVLDSGEVIHFQDPRMFGFIDAVPVSELPKRKAVAKLGLDPLEDDFTLAALRSALGDSRQPLKVALMDQERLAGLGNIHAAEALFRARLHPSRTAASLTPAEWKALHQGIRATIDFALKLEGDGDDIEYVEEPGAKNPFLIYGRAGLPCRRCRTLVKSFTQAGRTTHFCPKCQPAPSSKQRRSKT
ncbi:MAG: bifunctional DNA-formamidopyrimidine glycosylase/DNA-(apurinic or apyrimidinic site) lyase [Myxococcota bacterium]